MSLRAGSIMARASSGSRSCSSSVEPLISANSAVTVLRSPSASPGSVGSSAARTPEVRADGDEVGTAVASLSGAPHLPQKSDAGAFSALHFAHCFASAFPHFAQKLFVEGLLASHFG